MATLCALTVSLQLRRRNGAALERSTAGASDVNPVTRCTPN